MDQGHRCVLQESSLCDAQLPPAGARQGGSMRGRRERAEDTAIGHLERRVRNDSAGKRLGLEFKLR